MKRIIKFLPNSISVARIVLAIFFAVGTLQQFVDGKDNLLFLAFLFFTICVSDLLDGKIARKTGATSSIGAKLDVFADLFFMISSYITLIMAKLLPIWFLGFICLKFTEFLITSNFIKVHNNSSKHPFVFDKLGRITAVGFFIIPGIVCALKAFMPNNAMYLILFFLFTLLAAGASSSILRIKECFRLLSISNKAFGN